MSSLISEPNRPLALRQQSPFSNRKRLLVIGFTGIFWFTCHMCFGLVLMKTLTDIAKTGASLGWLVKWQVWVAFSTLGALVQVLRQTASGIYGALEQAPTSLIVLLGSASAIMHLFCLSVFIRIALTFFALT